MLRPIDTATRERKPLTGLWQFALDGDDEETVQGELRRHVVEINRCRSSVVRAMRTLAASIMRPSWVAAP